MEILNQLEQRVQSLLEEVATAREEKKRALVDMGAHATELQALKEENQKLKEALVQEKQVRDEVLQRIDMLLERLKDLG